MVDRTIARRYARAFIELAEEAGVIDAAGKDLSDALDVFQSHGGSLFEALCNPGFTIEERRAVLDAVFPKLGLGPVTRNLLLVLLDRRRFRLLPEVVQHYRDYADTKANRVRVVVETAEPLTPQLEAEVIAALQAVTGKDVLIDTRVDPSLIGGMVARVGGKVYDASVRTRLENLKHRLLSATPPALA